MLAKQRIRISIGAMIITAVASVLMISAPLHAVEATGTDSVTSSNVLRVSPVRSDVQILPGASRTVKVTLSNLTNSDLEIHPIENDFISGDESGTPSLILDENEFAPTHSLKRYMKPLSNFDIAAGASKSIDVEINVPADAQAGGYFGAIRFVPASVAGGGQVNLNASVASLILLTVPGDIIEDLDLSTFQIMQGDKVGNGFFSTPKDLSAAFRFENKGNVQVGPFGKISVMQGDEVVYEYDFNDKSPRDVVLPDGARKWDVPLQGIGTFGHFKVVATLAYGEKNQTIEVSQSFWVIPTGVIIAAVAGVVALAAIVAGIILFLRSYKKRILRKHGVDTRR